MPLQLLISPTLGAPAVQLQGQGAAMQPQSSPSHPWTCQLMSSATLCIALNKYNVTSTAISFIPHWHLCLGFRRKYTTSLLSRSSFVSQPVQGSTQLRSLFSSQYFPADRSPDSDSMEGTERAVKVALNQTRDNERLIYFKHLLPEFRE